MSRPNAKTSRDHWDSLAERYDDLKQRNNAYYDALKSLFGQAIPLSARGRILDVGCGTGQLLASLRPSEGVGVDVSAKMIDEARVRFKERTELTFAALDGSCLAGLGEFDAVVCADVLEHVPDWKQVVRAMVRACRFNGLIAISTPNPLWTLPLWILERLGLKMPEGPHEFVYAQHIERLLDELGCRVVSSATHQMVPIKLLGLGTLASRAAEQMPITRRLGVIQLTIAQRFK